MYACMDVVESVLHNLCEGVMVGIPLDRLGKNPIDIRTTKRSSESCP